LTAHTNTHTQKLRLSLFSEAHLFIFVFYFLLFLLLIVDVEHLRQSNSSLDSGQSMWPSHRRSIGMHGPFSHENSPSGHLVHSSLLFHDTHMTRLMAVQVMYSSIIQYTQLFITLLDVS
jgi:hypothetical protein